MLANLPQYVSLSQLKALKIKVSIPIPELILGDQLRYAYPAHSVPNNHALYEYDHLAFAAYDALEKLPEDPKTINDVENVQRIYFDESSMSYEPDNDYGLNDGKEMPFPHQLGQFIYVRHSSLFQDKKTKEYWTYLFESYDTKKLVLWNKRPAGIGYEDRYWLRPLKFGPMITAKNKIYAGLLRDGDFSMEELERISEHPVEIENAVLLYSPPLLDDPKEKQSRSNPVKDTMESAYCEYQKIQGRDPTYIELFAQMKSMSRPPIEVEVDWKKKIMTIGHTPYDFDKSKDSIRQRYKSIHKKLRMDKDG